MLEDVSMEHSNFLYLLINFVFWLWRAPLTFIHLWCEFKCLWIKEGFIEWFEASHHIWYRKAAIHVVYKKLPIPCMPHLNSLFTFAVRHFPSEGKNTPIFDDASTCTEWSDRAETCNTVTGQIMFHSRIFVSSPHSWFQSYRVSLVFLCQTMYMINFTAFFSLHDNYSIFVNLGNMIWRHFCAFRLNFDLFFPP
jgi:hypothetical protein